MSIYYFTQELFIYYSLYVCIIIFNLKESNNSIIISNKNTIHWHNCLTNFNFSVNKYSSNQFFDTSKTSTFSKKYIMMFFWSKYLQLPFYCVMSSFVLKLVWVTVQSYVQQPHSEVKNIGKLILFLVWQITILNWQFHWMLTFLHIIPQTVDIQ